MAESWGDKVHGEVNVEQKNLSSRNESTEDEAWFAQVIKEEQMHAFIFGLFKQMVNPAVVVFAASQTSEVALHATNHTWHASHSFQEDATIQPSSFIHFLWVVEG